MKYIRIKTKDGYIVQSQIIPEDNFTDWLKKNNIESYLKDGISISFSVVKKSSLLINK